MNKKSYKDTLIKIDIKNKLLSCSDLFKAKDIIVRKQEKNILLSENYIEGNNSQVNIYYNDDIIILTMDKMHKIEIKDRQISTLLKDIINFQPIFQWKIHWSPFNDKYRLNLSFPIKNTLDKDLELLVPIICRENISIYKDFNIYLLDFYLMATNLDNFQENLSKYNNYILKNKALPYSGLDAMNIEKQGGLLRFWETEYIDDDNDFNIIFNNKNNHIIALLNSEKFGSLGLIPPDIISRLMIYKDLFPNYHITSKIEGGNYRFLENKADTCKTNVETHFTPYVMKVVIKI